jgi:predicted RNA-binding Zn ribbon-like protein
MFWSSALLAVKRIPSDGVYVLCLGEMNVGTSAQQPEEWIDGFLFVGNYFALDFLNTRLVNEEGPVELLPDTASLSRWFEAAGLPKGAGKDRTAQTWQNSQSARRFLKDLLVFREELRSTVLRLESGKNPEPAFLEELNKKLLAYPHRYILVSNRSGTRRQTYVDPAVFPRDLWRELADSAAHLLTDVPLNRLRKCERCVVNFYDISKKGSRRWCSMHLCGNREKVSTYRRKQRGRQA